MITGTKFILRNTKTGLYFNGVAFSATKEAAKMFEVRPLDLFVSSVWANAVVEELPLDQPNQLSTELLTALTEAESFMSGFEDDGIQEGVAEKLARLRLVIGKAQLNAHLFDAAPKLRDAVLAAINCGSHITDECAELLAQAFAEVQGGAS